MLVVHVSLRDSGGLASVLIDCKIAKFPGDYTLESARRRSVQWFRHVAFLVYPQRTHGLFVAGESVRSRDIFCFQESVGIPPVPHAPRLDVRSE